MIARLPAFVVLAILAGALLALFTPKTEAIWANYTIRNLPGPPSDTGILTCGWHSSACPGSGMVALDWDDYGGSTVYWRSWVYHQYASPNSVNTACHTTRVRVVSNQSGQFMGYVYYTHTQSNGAAWSILGSSSWSYTKAPIATRVTSEFGGCPFDGTHIHQADDSSQWTENAAYPTSAQCVLCAWQYNVAYFGNYQFVRSGSLYY